MPTPLTDLEIALHGIIHDDLPGSFSAYVERETGKVYQHHEYMEDLFDELPADIDNPDKYVPFPSKAEFGLGKPLAIRFVSEIIPERLEQVHLIFNGKGAFYRFKNMLEQIDQLKNWYDFQNQHEKKALLAWCERNKIEVILNE